MAKSLSNYFELVFSQPDVLQLQEFGDFGDENFLPPLNLIRSTKLHLTTEPPISYMRCNVLTGYKSCLGAIGIKYSNARFVMLIFLCELQKRMISKRWL
ncbi:MAG: hypothetical protein KA987_15965 [Saprospiraceae bacterium]|nr:hypothetical protein [Candidatus Vicinibacter affinis]MBP7307616.1 hypothetical protein [Saprospiraceae bacterium]